MLPERQFIDEASWYPQEQEQVHLEVYTNNKPKHKKRHLRKLSQKQKLVFCLVMIFALSLVYVSLEAKITQVGYAVNQLKSDISDAQEANDRLMLEVEQLSSPERIAQYAEEKDNMVVAGEGNVLYADIETPEQAADEQNSTAAATEQQTAEKTEMEKSGLGPVASVIDKFSNARSEAAAMAE